MKRKTPRPPLKLLSSSGSFYHHSVSAHTSPTRTYAAPHFDAHADEAAQRRAHRQRRVTENCNWSAAVTLPPPHTTHLPRAGSVSDFRTLQTAAAPTPTPPTPNCLQRWASHSDLTAPVKARRKLPVRPDEKSNLTRSYSFDPPPMKSNNDSWRKYPSSSDEPRHLLQARLKCARSMVNLVQNKAPNWHHYPQLQHRKSVYHTIHGNMWMQQRSSSSSSEDVMSNDDADDEAETATMSRFHASRAAKRNMVGIRKHGPPWCWYINSLFLVISPSTNFCSYIGYLLVWSIKL